MGHKTVHKKDICGDLPSKQTETDMYTPAQALTAAGMQDRKPTFDRWLQAGIARPTTPTRGSGYPAEWSGEALIALTLTALLGQAGMNLKRATDLAGLATKNMELLSLLGWEVLIDLQTGEFYRSSKYEQGAQDWRQNRETVLVIDMDKIEMLISQRLGIDALELGEIK